MQTRFLILSIAIAAMLGILVTADPARAAPNATTTTEIVKGHVQWVLSPDTCPEIQYELTGTGKRFQVITTVTKADGSKKIYNNDFVSGTATDTNGGTYDWIYTNQDRHKIPASGGPIKVNMTDTFVLTGEGSANINLGFVWKWTFTPPDPEWPPVNNWDQKITIGYPLHCDPI